jgi:alkanesulfonate monooxygenase SsuD/methylene tetrahydromethanopterin reductase-like flavin-dependent oxidoreductase (luciferase family)
MNALASSPLGSGSVSLRLYPHDLPPADIVTELRAQASMAEEAGFDGVMTSEHHGGVPNYLPNPLLAATWALEATQRLWAAPCPTLLPLRAATHVVEDLAWTAQRFPGRLGVGFASGAFERDFELAGVPFEEMVSRFSASLSIVASALAGAPEEPLAADPAVAALSSSPIPAVSAVASPGAARRAASFGLGVLFDSIMSIQRAAQLVDVHRWAGGGGARILIRRAWVGDPPADNVAVQMTRYRAAASRRAAAHWAPDGGLVAATDPAEVADRLHDQLVGAGCEVLNIRVFHAGCTPHEVRQQIALLGNDVLPRVRRRLVGAHSEP